MDFKKVETQFWQDLQRLKYILDNHYQPRHPISAYIGYSQDFCEAFVELLFYDLNSPMETQMRIMKILQLLDQHINRPMKSHLTELRGLLYFMSDSNYCAFNIIF